MKPTKEQVEAAKAWARCDESSRQHALLLGGHTHDSMGRIVAEILLAALEAAEHAAKGAQAKVKEWEDEAARQGGMHAGGFEYFTARVRNANQQAHNAIYVAQQLEKKLEAAEADSARLDWLEKEAVDLSYIQRITLNETDAPLGPVFVAWGGDGNLRAVVDAARKEDQP